MVDIRVRQGFVSGFLGCAETCGAARERRSGTQLKLTSHGQAYQVFVGLDAQKDSASIGACESESAAGALRWDGVSRRQTVSARVGQGYFTDEVASLCAAASISVRETLLARALKQVTDHARVVQRPFSAQMNWSAYDRAFRTLLWTSGFLWAWLERSPRPSQIEQVLRSAEVALARRNEGEWQRSGSSHLFRYRQSHVPTS